MPERILRPWRAAAKPELELDDLAELAGALTDPQARSMQDYWGWYLAGTELAPPDYFYSNRYHLRFWNSLSRRQRQSARAGVLAVTELNPAQRQAWTEALYSPPVTLHAPMDLKRAPSDAELAAGGFSLTSEAMQEQLFTRADPERMQRFSTSISAPAGQDIRALNSGVGDGIQEDGLPTPYTDHRFEYYLRGEMKPARRVRVGLAGKAP